MSLQQGNRRERKKERTREAIISAALKLFREKSFELTSMEQIAEEADISKATLYKYFPAKEAIIGGYLSDTVRDNEPELDKIISRQPDTRSRLVTFFLKISEWNELNRDLVRLHATMRFNELAGLRMAPERESSLQKVLERIIIAGQSSGKIRRDISAEALALYLRTMYMVPFMAWLAGCDHAANQKNIVQLADLFLGGAAAPL